MSYKRMRKQEERLQGLVDELLAGAEAADDGEDTRYGKDRRGDELPEELQRAESRLEKIRELKAALEIATGKRKSDGSLALRGRIPRGISIRDRMRRKLFRAQDASA